MTRRSFVAAGVLGLAAILGAILPFARRLLGRKPLRFPYLGEPISNSDYAALASKPGWAKTSVAVAPGVHLNGLVRRPQSASAPWVLFYPGNDASQLTRGQAFLLALAADRDWGLATFAYRGYDGSAGSFDVDSMRADAPVILANFCAAQQIEASRVHVVGFSIGGYFAVNAAGGAAKSGRRAATLVLLASVNDITMYRRSPWSNLSAGDAFETTPYLADVPAPVLVIQGAADSTFHGPSEGRAIAAALDGRARYEELPGVDHVPLLSDANALALVRTFIQQHEH